MFPSFAGRWAGLLCSRGAGQERSGLSTLKCAVTVWLDLSGHPNQSCALSPFCMQAACMENKPRLPFPG